MRWWLAVWARTNWKLAVLICTGVKSSEAAHISEESCSTSSWLECDTIILLMQLSAESAPGWPGLTEWTNRQLGLKSNFFMNFSTALWVRQNRLLSPGQVTTTNTSTECADKLAGKENVRCRVPRTRIKEVPEPAEFTTCSCSTSSPRLTVQSG